MSSPIGSCCASCAIQSPASTNSSYLAHTDLKEELSNQDICTFIHNHFKGKSLPDITCTHAHFYSSSCSGGLSLAFSSALNLPKTCFSQQWNGYQVLLTKHSSISQQNVSAVLQAPCRAVGWMLPMGYIPPSHLLMTSPVISIQHASLICSPHCRPNRGKVWHAKMLVWETEDHSCTSRR